MLSRAIQLSWQPPSEQEQNGVIVGYKIQLSRAVNPRDFILLETENKTLLIGEVYIKPFTQYLFRIAAFTTAGTGPFSESLRINSLEDGKPSYDAYFVYYGYVMKYLFLTVPSRINFTHMSLVPGKPSLLSIDWNTPLEPNGELVAYSVYCKKSVHQPLSECDSNHGTQCQDMMHNTTYQRQAVLPVGLNQTAILDGFDPFTNYTCYMTASTSAGESLPSNTASAITDESGEYNEMKFAIT